MTKSSTLAGAQYIGASSEQHGARDEHEPVFSRPEWSRGTCVTPFVCLPVLVLRCLPLAIPRSRMLAYVALEDVSSNLAVSFALFLGLFAPFSPQPSVFHLLAPTHSYGKSSQDHEPGTIDPHPTKFQQGYY